MRITIKSGVHRLGRPAVRCGARLLVLMCGIASALSLLAAMPAAQATPITWGSGTAVWQTGASWVGGTAPASSTTTDTAIFTGASTQNAQLNAAASITGITINNTGATNVQSDSTTSRTLTIGGSGINIQAGAGAVTFGIATNNPLTITATTSQTWTNNSANAASIVGVVTSGAATLTLGGSGNFSFNANNSVSAAGVWDFTGSGQLSFGGNANANFLGTLNIGSGGGTLVLANATVLASAAGVNIKGGTVAANGNRTLSANTVVSNDFTLGQASGNTGNVTLAGNVDLGGAVRTITGVSGHTDVISGVISNGGITKNSAAQLNFTGTVANTYTGTTTVNEGTLYLQKTSGVNAIVGALTIGDGTNTDQVNLGASEQIADTVVVNMIGTTSNARGGIQLLSFNETIGGLSGGGQVQNASSTGDSLLTLNVADATTQTSSAVLRNTGGVTTGKLSIVKTGGGTQILSGNLTYTGTTTVNAGTLQISGNNSGIAFGTTTVNAGTLQIGHSNALGISALALNGGAVSSSGTASFSPANNITIGGNVAIGNATNNGALTFGGTVDLGAGTRTLQIESDVTLNGIVSNGGLTKSGTGSVILGGANTFSGGLTLNSGVLKLAAGNTGSVGAITDSALGTGSLTLNGGTLQSNGAANRNILNAVTIGGNVTLGAASTGSLNFSAATDLNGASRTLTTESQTTFSGIVSNGGIVAAATSSGKTLTLSASNSYSLGTTLNSSFAGSTVAVGNVNALGTGPLAVNAGTVNLGTTGVSVGLLSGSSGATITTGTSASVTLTTTGATNSIYGGAITNGSGTVALVKAGAGVLTLSGSSNYSGGTTINAGGISAGNANAFGAGAVTLAGGATLDVGSLTVSNAITNNGGTISNAANYAGTQTLNGASTFGSLGGTLVVSSGGTATFGGPLAAATTINAGGRGILNDAGSISAASLTNNGTFTIDRTGSSSLATAFSGNGTLVKAGTGVVSLTGASGFSGSTQVNAGDLRVNGSLAGGVDVAASSTLGGSGSVGAISGAGLVGPGNSPGILTATSVDPSGGLSFAFEFGAAAPNYSSPTSSDNDVLWLTGGTPFTTSLTGSSNTVSIYFTQAAVELGTLTGGFYTANAVDFLSSIGSATFQYFVQDANGSSPYNGVMYKTLAQYDPAKSVTVSTVSQNGGQVMQLVVVPEPAGIVIAGMGVILAGWAAARRAGGRRR